MRVFAAIPLPEPVVEHLQGRVDSVRATLTTSLITEPTAELDAAGPSAWRWAAPDDWHLTLAFFGVVTEDQVMDLRQRLRRTAGRHLSPTLEVTGSGQFGRRVLWAGVGGDRGSLRRLARSVAAAGRRAGADLNDQGRYRPHVTLARAASPRRGEDVTDDEPSRQAIASAVDALADYRGPEWTASAFTLVRSDLGAGPRGRARHTILETFPLTGPARSATARARGNGPSRDREPPDRGGTTGRR